MECEHQLHIYVGEKRENHGGNLSIWVFFEFFQNKKPYTRSDMVWTLFFGKRKNRKTQEYIQFP